MFKTINFDNIKVGNKVLIGTKFPNLFQSILDEEFLVTRVTNSSFL